VQTPGGAPIPGAAVLLGLSALATDGQGRFSYDNLPAGTYTLSAQDAGGDFTCVFFALSAGSHNVTITLPSAAGQPHAVSVNPPLNAVGAALDSDLVLTFSAPIDAASVAPADFAITPQSVSFTVTTNGTEVLIRPQFQLPLDQQVLVELVGELRATTGEAVARPVRWRFRTAAVDTFPPRLLSVDPAPGTTNFPINMALVLDYSEPLAQPDSGLTVTSTPDAQLTATVSAKSLIIDAQGGWLKSTDYEVHVNGVADLSGNRAVSSTMLTFTTGTELAPHHDIQPEWNRVLNRIVFASNRISGYDIFSVDPDGTGLLRLTSDPGSELHPTLSSDGALLAYQRRSPAGDWDVYVQNMDGTGTAADVTTPAFNDYQPVFTRTYSRNIVFVSDRNNRTTLYMMASDGSSPAEIDRTFGGSQTQPALHPLIDRQILFTSQQGDYTDVWRKIVSAVDGSATNANLTLTLLSSEHSPAWSPDASFIAFVSDHSGVDNLWVADPTGDFPRQITFFDRPLDDPSISPQVDDARCVASLANARGGSDIVLIDLVSGVVLQNLTGEEGS